MPRVTLEVCVDSVESAVAAAEGGADRLELCSELHQDGWTPAHRKFCAVRRALRLPVVVLIRRSCVRFVHTAKQVASMANDIRRFLPLGPTGFVFGTLSRDRRVEAETAALLVAACGPVPAVFHRAFDEVADKPAALEELIRLGFTRVLTSGGPGGVPANLPMLKALVKQAAGRIEVMPGGGVTAAAAAGVVQFTGCEHLHGSFSEPTGRRRRTSREAVAAARAAVDQVFGPMASG